ncbi:MAG: rhomboid family intramembrane serine protease [Myxococcales bacterium]
MPGQRARLGRALQRAPWVSLLATGCGLLASALPASPSLLAYTSQGVERGQLWRLWSAHFVHYNGAHLWGDLLAFAVWAALVESESRRALLSTLLLGAPLLMSVLALGCPSLAEYRGLSGLDTALVIELILLRGFAAPARGGERGFGPWLTRRVGRAPLRYIGVFSLGLSAVKIVYESCAGHALIARDLGNGVTLLPAAHAVGAGVGLLVCWALPPVKVARLTRSLTPQY